MAITHSPGLKNYDHDSGFKSAFNTTGVIKIYTGSKPATADLAPTGTLLATLTLSATAFGAASGGVSTANSITSDTNAAATGTAGWFRVQLTGDAGTTNNTDKRLDGTVTTTGGGGDMQLNNTSIVTGGTVAITAFTYTHPA